MFLSIGKQFVHLSLRNTISSVIHCSKFSSCANTMAGQNGYLPLPKGFTTIAIHSYQEPDQWDSMAVVPPIVSSTTFKQYGPGQLKKYVYGRDGNPNRDLLEKCLASLENGKYGLCFSSGLGATTAICKMFKKGDHIVSCDDIYGGTNELFVDIFTDLDISFVAEEKIEAAIKPNTRMIWVESLTNPTMKVINVKKIAEIAHKHNILLAVDSTFLTPYFQRPLDLGADLVVHSITKYLNGHSDVIMGVAVTNNEELYKKLNAIQKATGNVPAPFDCYQVTRSLKTLSLRMQQHMKNSVQVGQFLEKHPKVEKVLHPGLPSHPQHKLLKTLASGCGGMLSFYIKGGLVEAERFLKALQVFTLAESLGDVKSLAEIPAVMTHVAVPEEQRKALKITDNLIRMSIGLEDVEDLIADIQQALENV